MLRFTLLLWLAFLPAVAIAEESAWIGRTVFFKDGVTGKLGSQEIQLEGSATITRVNGKWLWAEEAWVEEKDVLTVDQALVYFTHKIRSKPSAYDWFCRASAWSEKKEYDKAIKDYTEAIRLDPEDAAAYFNRGNAWDDKGDYDKAIKDYTEAIRLDPEDITTYLIRGNEWLKQEEYDNAIKDYTEAIRLDPKQSNSYLNRGAAWAKKSEFANAITDFTQAIRLDPKEVRAYYYRGYVRRENGEYGNAINDYTEAIRLDPEYVKAYHSKAWLLATCPDARFRDGEQAVHDANKACELYSWKEVRGLGTLAAAYAEAGDFKNAIKWLKTAIELDTKKELPDLQDHLKLYESGKPYRELPENSKE